jgi:N-acetylmuramic acid 6-phosphate etherase
VFLACVPRDQAPDSADISIRVITGPKSSPAARASRPARPTKLVLNTVTTLAMVRLGKVHGNLMVDVNTRGNTKLWQRGIGLVARIAQVDREEAERLLESAGGAVKTAVVMRARSLSRLEAEDRLAALRRRAETCAGMTRSRRVVDARLGSCP